jgi:hypothetical protein
MLLKSVPGVRVLVSTVNTMISAWYVMGREVYWWHSHPINAHIVAVRVFRWWVNFRIDARFVEVLAGHTSLKTRLPSDERRYAT